MLKLRGRASLASWLHMGLLLLMLVSGCGSSEEPPPMLSVNRILEEVTVLDDALNPYSGEAIAAPIPPDGAGPALVFSTNANVQTVRGGSAILNLEAPKRAEALLIGTPNGDSSYRVDLTALRAARMQVGDDEYRQVPGSSTSVRVSKASSAQPLRDGFLSYDLLLTFPVAVADPQIPLSVVAVYGQDAAERYSPPAQALVSFNPNGEPSANLQVSISWRGAADVDLHVLPPGGAEIGFNRRTNSGGTLDVDGNPDCDEPRGTVENITWKDTVPPVGIYQIRPNYYNDCQVGDTKYAVTVRRLGLTRIYYDRFLAMEQNRNAGTDPKKLIALAVLAPADTDEGLLSRMLLAEPKGPAYQSFDLSATTKAMKALRALVENRKRKPGLFGASGATTREIITAPRQFEGFTGGVSSTIEDRVRALCLPPALTTTYVPYWQAMFSVVRGPVEDPFQEVQKVGDQPVERGTFGVQTEGSTLGGNFVPLPGGRLAGQEFYTLKAGVL